MPQDVLDTAAKCPWLQDPTPVVQQEDDDDIFGFDIAGLLSQSPAKEAPPVPSQAMEVDEDTEMREATPVPPATTKPVPRRREKQIAPVIETEDEDEDEDGEGDDEVEVTGENLVSRDEVEESQAEGDDDEEEVVVKQEPVVKASTSKAEPSTKGKKAGYVRSDSPPLRMGERVPRLDADWRAYLKAFGASSSTPETIRADGRRRTKWRDPCHVVYETIPVGATVLADTTQVARMVHRDVLFFVNAC